jgi:hypothetical protein
VRHIRRSWTPRSGWRLRDRLDKAWRWPLYSRGRAIGTLAAAVLVVVIWPRGAGSEQATVAAATAPNPTAQTSEVMTSRSAQAQGSTVSTSSTPNMGTNLTASPTPPTLTTAPEQYRTAEAVATQYLQVWCWQPAAAPANSNLTDTAPWITPAGQADDLTRSATWLPSLTSICGPVAVTQIGEQPSAPDRTLLQLSTRQAFVNTSGVIVSQQTIEQTRRIVRDPDGRWLVDTQVQAG